LYFVSVFSYFAKFSILTPPIINHCHYCKICKSHTDQFTRPSIKFEIKDDRLDHCMFLRSCRRHLPLRSLLHPNICTSLVFSHSLLSFSFFTSNYQLVSQQEQLPPS
jgi:hypothetical protein